MGRGERKKHRWPSASNHYKRLSRPFSEITRRYVAVDEAKRSLLGDGSIKSLDFIVTSTSGRSWLVDIKGRRFPSGEQKQYWKNWSTRDDLFSLARWQRLFGERFTSLLVFAYNVVGGRSPLPLEQLYEFRGGLYGFVAIPVEEYAYHAHEISPRWDTLAMPVSRFRQLAAPFQSLL